MVATDQFLLGLGKIEGEPLTFGQGTDPEDQESHRLAPDVPAEDAGAGLLIVDPNVDPFNPNVVRASLGTLFSVPLGVAATDEERQKYSTDFESLVLLSRERN